MSIVKHVKELQTSKKARKKYSEFVVEGFKTIRDFLRYDNSYYEMISLILDEGTNLDETILNSAIKPKIHYTKKFQTISETKTPQGILGIIRYKRQEIDLNSEKILFCENIQDPGNMGTIIRTADAAGFNAVILKECVDIYNPKTIRATMGSIFNIPLFETEDIEILTKFKKHKIIATDLSAKEFYFDVDMRKNIIIIIGNEGNGVSTELLSLAHRKIKIPMLGEAESLNAAIASSLIMYEIVRQEKKF